ncbi:Lipoprotein [Chitinispirillum alkaliphilum]|nr:Lipoprotein [Chitinispirillum alkaliphilum]
MKSILSVFALFPFVLLAINCQGKTGDYNLYGSYHNSRNALDWAGVYRGGLPGEQCDEGVKALIRLRQDLTFDLQRSCLGNTKSWRGNFLWSDNGGKISLYNHKGDPLGISFLIGENRLFLLEGDGNSITLNHDDIYILHKELQ